MATYTLKEIVDLFKAGKSLDGIVALEAYEASVSAGRLRGARKKSEARSQAARENGKKGGRPRSHAFEQALAACEESRQRMNTYTAEQRAELEAQAREIIADGQSEAAKRRWEARQGRGHDSVPLAKENHSGSGGAGSAGLPQEAKEFWCDNPIYDLPQGPITKPALPPGAGSAVPVSDMQAMKTAHDVLFGGKLPPGVMKGSQLEGRG